MLRTTIAELKGRCRAVNRIDLQRSRRAARAIPSPARIPREPCAALDEEQPRPPPQHPAQPTEVLPSGECPATPYPLRVPLIVIVVVGGPVLVTRGRADMQIEVSTPAHALLRGGERHEVSSGTGCPFSGRYSIGRAVRETFVTMPNALTHSQSSPHGSAQSVLRAGLSPAVLPPGEWDTRSLTRGE